jgi:hypothetical protein
MYAHPLRISPLQMGTTRLLVFGLGSLSILCLLLYFHGVLSFELGAIWLLPLEFCGLVAVMARAHAANHDELRQRLVAGLWAGGLATLAYDLVRLPIAHAGIPVFKAISYFGTVLLGLSAPTFPSELAGWAYHLSNGVSFGLMYAMLVRQPGPISAVVWGLVLEGIMLLTPYAEVFGYRMDARFLAITVGAHAVYGLVLWIALRPWGFPASKLSTRSVMLGFLGVPCGIALIAADFHGRYAKELPPSPPPYIGSHLYTTWDVPEPDRLAALWVVRRFVNPAARFHFVPPFSPVRYGQPFDLPEAEIRRKGTSSATEVLLTRYGLEANERLRSLAAMTHLAEVTPWLLPAHQDADQLNQAIRGVTANACGHTLRAECVEVVLTFLDGWYQRE